MVQCKIGYPAVYDSTVRLGGVPSSILLLLVGFNMPNIDAIYLVKPPLDRQSCIISLKNPSILQLQLSGNGIGYGDKLGLKYHRLTQLGGHLIGLGGYINELGGYLIQLGGYIIELGGGLIELGGYIVELGGGLNELGGYIVELGGGLNGLGEAYFRIYGYEGLETVSSYLLFSVQAYIASFILTNFKKMNRTFIQTRFQVSIGYINQGMKQMMS